MSDVVLDASVVIAAVLQEPGGGRAIGHARSPLVSAVNYAEICTRLTDLGMNPETIEGSLKMLRLDVVPFDKEQAERVAALRNATRSSGLSLGDRACLALGASREALVLTADRAWRALDLPIQIEQVRDGGDVEGGNG